MEYDKKIMQVIDAPCSGRLYIGKQGENLARRVKFELPPDWDMADPAASVHLAVQRAGEDTAYPVMLTCEDGAYYWDVTATDTACPGYNQCELRYMLGDVIKKSMTWVTTVAKSISDDMTDPPEAGEEYLTRVMQEGAKVTQAAGRIAQAEQQARAALEEIAPAAEQAVSEIRSAGDAQAKRLDEAGAAALRGITDAGDDQTNRLSTAGDTQVQRVVSEGAAQIAAAKEQADRAESAAIRQPYPDESTGTWWCWDADAGAYVDSGIKAKADELHVASPDVLGGVQPVTKTDDMTIPVGVDADGKLYTGKDPDVNQLKDDLADKLTKSPSDWEVWTAKEQAVARERMGVVSSDEVSTMITDALGVIENGSY